MNEYEIESCTIISEFLLKGGSDIYIPPYNSSWDNLMPVVEKIERMNYIVKITEKSCSIQNRNINKIKPYYHSYTTSESKIHAVFNCVIHFIKWVENIN